jgi:hypothetical protein
MRRGGAIFFLSGLLALLAAAAPASAQAARVAPDGYQVHEETTVGPFAVRRWVSKAEPEVSPAGMCDCLLAVYRGDTLVLTIGTPGAIEALTIAAPSGRDIDGDGLPDLIVSSWSGGAHCCYATTVYSIGAAARVTLAIDTGNCGQGDFADLDGDRVLEFVTCDDQFAYAYCPFAVSPFPTVVLGYDRSERRYRPATPRFALQLRATLDRDEAAARAALTAPGAPADQAKCTVLQPVLGLFYAGLVEDGLKLLRGLYRGADAEDLAAEALAAVRASRLWTAN